MSLLTLHTNGGDSLIAQNPLRFSQPIIGYRSMMDFDQLSEQELLSYIHDGDISAKKYLYNKHSRYLTGVCARYIIDKEDIRDIIQESFLHIFSAIGAFEFRGAGSLRGWMTRIVVNESLKFLKSVCKFDMIPLSAENEQIQDDEPEMDGIPLSVLHSMIRELPIGYRTILNLYVFEEKSHKEIARILNIKENTSASQFHRAKRLLAEKIKKYSNYNLSIAYER